MNLKTFSKLCTPARLYFVVAMVMLILLVLTNLNNDSNVLCIGDYSCNVPDKVLVVLLNFLYIVFWTYLLNLICKDNWKSLAWFLVLFPFIIVILFMIFFMEKM